MPHSSLQRPDAGRVREWLTSAALAGFFVFSWMSVGITRYNGLDSPLFLGASALCLWRLAGGPLTVAAPLLRAYLLWAGWVVFSDFYLRATRTGCCCPCSRACARAHCEMPHRQYR